MRCRDWAIRFAWACIALLFVLFLCQEWFGPDIWYHLYLGQRIFETGRAQPTDHLILHQATFVNTYWLFQVAVRAVYGAGGIYGVTALFIALWALAISTWLKSAGLTGDTAWGPILGMAAVMICQTRFEIRPEVLSYLFLALQLHWLMHLRRAEQPTAWEYLRIILVQILWSNVHGYFVLGPMLVTARVAGALAQGRAGLPGPPSGAAGPAVPPYPQTRAVADLTLLLALTVLATLATPFGLANWREVIVLGRFFREMRFSIQEFLPPTRVPVHLWGVDVFGGYWWAVLTGAAFLAWTAGRRELFALLLAAAGLVLSAASYRNLPLLVFLSAPAVAALLPRLARFSPPLRPAALAVGALALVLGANVASSHFYLRTGGVPGFGIRESRYGYPVDFAAYLRAHPFGGAIFDNPGDGGYLEFHIPDLRLYADSRFVDAPLVRGYFRALADPASFRAAQALIKSDAVLLRVTDSPGVVADRLREPGWALAYGDLHRAFLVDRRTPAGKQAVIGPLQLYRGEDLSIPVNGASASAWVGLFVQTQDRPRLLLVLRQFSRANIVPAGLLQFAEQYRRAHPDPEIGAVLAVLRARNPP